MGRLGLGYGSEWHLLNYLGRHRGELNARVATVTGCDDVAWLDFPVRESKGRRKDEEWKGLDFVESPEIQRAWAAFWPQGSGIQNWDAVGRLRCNGRAEWLLVEAKGHCGEIESSCGAKPEGGLDTIRRALDATKVALGVDPARDWLKGYYQYCNRLAILHFLETQSIAARLLFIYFTGDTTPGRECPQDEAGWRAALTAQEKGIGLPEQHRFSNSAHKLFLPVLVR